jgi:hypothetical protein
MEPDHRQINDALLMIFAITAQAGFGIAHVIAISVDPFVGVHKEKSFGLTDELKDTMQFLRKPLAILITKAIWSPWHIRACPFGLDLNSGARLFATGLCKGDT